jgi:hypothetical protein
LYLRVFPEKMLSAGVSRVKREKTPEGLAKQLGALQAELKDGAIRALAEEGVGFSRAVEELGACVGRAVGQAAGKGKGAPPTAAWIAAGKAMTGVLITLCRRALRLDVMLAWDQAAVQAVTGCLLRLVAWPECTGDSLRAIAFVTAERGHMMTKEAQDATVAACLSLAAVSERLPSLPEEGDDEDAPEDDRDDKAAVAVAVAAPAARGVARSDQCGAALQCLLALAKGARRKSHFVEAHLQAVGQAAVANVASLVATVTRGGTGARVLAEWLQVLEAIIVAGGNLFAQLFQQRMRSLTGALCALLFTSAAVSGDDGPSDGFSSLSEGGSRPSPADRLRVHAMLALAALAGGPCFKQFSNDMLTLLPFSTQNKASFGDAKSLYSLLLHDPSHRIRMHAILLLHGLLKPAKQFFSAAMDVENPRQASFISLSQKLALTLRDVHAVLALALAREEDMGNRVLLLRLVPVVVGITPYDRLAGCDAAAGDEESMLLLPILMRVVADFEGPEKMGCILGVLRVKSDIAQVRLWIQRCDLVSFLAGLCVEASQPTAEACLVEVCARYVDLASPILIGSGGVLARLLSRQEVTVEVLQCAQELSGALVARSDAEGLIECWQSILRAALPRQASFFRESTPAAVSAAFVTLLASVPASVWAKQDERVHVTVIAAVSSAFDAEESPAAVRLASLRGVGQLLMLEELVRDNERFVTDVDSMIQAGLASSDALLVECAYWCMGNLAHALNAVAGTDDLMLGMLRETLKRALASTSKDEKVRCSCLRVLGKAAQRLRSDMFAPLAPATLRMVLEALGAKEKAKIRWNACNALSLVLEQKSWDPRIFGALTEILSVSTNYKERISAAAVIEKHAWIVPDAESFAMLAAKCILGELDAPANRKEKDLSDKYVRHLRAVLGASCTDSVRQRIGELIAKTPFELSEFLPQV